MITLPSDQLGLLPSLRMVVKYCMWGEVILLVGKYLLKIVLNLLVSKCDQNKPDNLVFVWYDGQSLKII